MAGDDITIEILKSIRDEARETKREFQEQFVAIDGGSTRWTGGSTGPAVRRDRPTVRRD